MSGERCEAFLVSAWWVELRNPGSELSEMDANWRGINGVGTWYWSLGKKILLSSDLYGQLSGQAPKGWDCPSLVG